MPWVSILGSVAGPILGGLFGDSASNTQAASTEAATAEQRREYDLTRSDNMPRVNTGNAASQRIAQLLGLNVPGDNASQSPKGADYGSLTHQFTGADLVNEPGYKFGLDQGLSATNGRLAAGGQRYGGAAIKAASKYANDYAGTKFSDAFNRDMAAKNQTYNQLAGVSGAGQIASNQVSNAGQNMANQVSSNLIGGGDARATGYLTTGNALGNAFSSGISAWNRSNGGGNFTPGQISSANSWNVPQYQQPAPASWG